MPGLTTSMGDTEMAANGTTQGDVEQFLYKQAEILDERRWDDWLGLFAEDGHYWMPVTREQTQRDGVPNIFNEDLNLMKIRVRRVTHPRAHSQTPPNSYSHVVSNVVIEEDNGDTVVARSKFFCSESRNDVLRSFAGSYRHQLQKTGDGFKIKEQRVDLVGGDGAYEYVLQYWL